METITEINNIAERTTSVLDKKILRRDIYGLIFSSKSGCKIRKLLEGIDVFEVNKNLLLSGNVYNSLVNASRRGNFSNFEMYLLSLNIYYRFGNEKTSTIMMYLSKLAGTKWNYRREAIISLALFFFVQAFEYEGANRKKLFTQVVKTLNSIDLRDEDDLVLSIFAFSNMFIGDNRKAIIYLNKVELKKEVHYKFLEFLTV
jgi:hypothetical protein